MSYTTTPLRPHGPAGVLRLPLLGRVSRLLNGIRERRAMRRYVVSNPHIRCGDPVVRGSRVSVYRLAELTEQGAPRQEILECHPSVTA